jgi:dTDP-4-dehydrorhamnose reductase
MEGMVLRMSVAANGLSSLKGQRVLLTGSSGQVGGELRHLLAPIADLTAPGREQVDLADVAGDFRALREMIRSVGPRWIVNPAAYTAVDKAEREPDLAYTINRDAVRVIGDEAQRIGAAVIHFSTDYVFAGEGSKPYLETDATAPMSVYGASKLAGEGALAQSGASHYIFRTSWVYGGQGKNFLLTILKAAQEREVLRVVGDQYGAPTWSRDLARMAFAVMERSGEADSQDLGGIYHAAGAGETTWFGFATEAVRLMHERHPALKLARIEEITTEEYPTPAKRPANSRLNCTKLAKSLQWNMMDWKTSLAEVITSL